MTMRITFAFGLFAALLSLDAATDSKKPPAAKEKNRAAFLKTYCVKCHNAEKHKGDIRLDQLALRVAGDNHKLWKEVVHNLQRGDMPPEDAKQPKAEERQAFLSEAIGSLTRYEVDAKGARDPLTRLTNNQIAHSLQDLLHTHQHIADELIGDPIDKHGYSRQTELGLSGPYLQLYAKSLARAVARAIPDPEAPAAHAEVAVVHHDGQRLARHVQSLAVLAEPTDGPQQI